jgi:RNA polymerase sigma-70 factor, ECF subfamily
MSDDDELQLVRRAAEGDRAALQRLLMRHHRRLTATVSAKLPDDLRGVLAAEDVVQETYIAAFREVRGFRPAGGGAFFAWLRTIADHKRVDAVRVLRALKRGGDRQARALHGCGETSVISLLRLAAAHGRTPSQSVALSELAGRMRVAVEQLSERHAEVIRLRYLEGLSVREAAERMQRSEGAVMMLCGRALRKLIDVVGDPSRFFSRT